MYGRGGEGGDSAERDPDGLSGNVPVDVKREVTRFPSERNASTFNLNIRMASEDVEQRAQLRQTYRAHLNGSAFFEGLF